MLTPEEFYSNTDHSPKPAPAASAPSAEEEMAERLFGGGAATPDLHVGGLTREQEMAETLFPDQGEDAPEQVYHRFDVPEDLRHLGLQHDAAQHREFSRLGHELGLSQEQAQMLVVQHLRAAHGGRR